MTLVVKLGSSIVAADDGSLRTDVLDSVCAQVSTLEKGGERVVMVTSGAIARGMRLLDLGERPRAMDELQATSALGQGDLFRSYESRLSKNGVRSAQVLLTLADISSRAHYVNARQTIQRLLDWGVVPIVNENDTTATDEITFGDNDFLAAQLAVLIDASLLVLLTNIDGLFTANPGLVPTARLIPEVSDTQQLERDRIGEETSVFGTGGMGRKVAAAEIASQSGVPTVICNGTAPGTLVEAAEGLNVGTRFKPHPTEMPAFKLWLKYAKRSTGNVYVDAGAAERLQFGGSSLLAVGITDLDGSFHAGDAVDVREGETENLIGRGISNFSARELLPLVGMQSVKIRELFAHADDEVIHRDRFVLL
ncbi:MAG TPA: glutamate 5-kinase [Solirubrobacterales bacterium]|nr:glutamate 5-kinase [Solirubrobacterales bacterium]